MTLSPSAHTDTFTRDRLPPPEQWPVFEFTIESVQYPDRLNAATELITRTAAMYPQRPALRTPDGTVWTYEELLARANRVANVLVSALGVVPGNRVLLRGANTPWLVACWLGVLKAGAVAVATMPVLRSSEVGALVAATEPTVMLCDERCDPLDADATAGVRIVGYGHRGTGELAELCAAASPEFADVETAADDVALLGPTSGSTGVPKVTMHFHRDVLANADTFALHLLRPTPQDVFAGSPPLAFTFGLGGLVVFPLRFGASSLLTERATPVQLAELCAQHGVTALFTAPTAYRAILREGKADALASLRVAVSAGEHLVGELWTEFKEATGLELLNGIGATEMLHIFIAAAGPDAMPGSTGVAVPGYRATILDDEGREVGPGVVGHLAVVGPTGCRYLGGERQTRYVRDGWNLTGDLFSRDEAGRFWFQSRADDLIVTSGFNVGAPEVEAALMRHPDVLESAVAGKPDPERGAIICAHVVLREGRAGDDALAEELRAFVKGVIAPYKAPREIVFVSSLPRNPSGKLQRFRIHEGGAS